MRRVRERPLRSVPVWIWGALGGALAVQITVGISQPVALASAGDLPAPPSALGARLASFGEPVATAKIAMLWLQAFDFQSGNRIPYRDLNYTFLEGWLERILELDPSGQYPLMSAGRLYAEVPDTEKSRAMIELILREFKKDPNHRWPWAAHAAVIAKHRLKDLPLAERIALALQQDTTADNVPVWVRSMRAFILEDMDELEAARVLIGGLVSSGRITSERERALLESRLRAIEDRIHDVPRRN